MNRLPYIAAWILCLGWSVGFSQHELNSHFMTGMWQATKTNPAMRPDAHIVVALPTFYSSTFNSSFNFDDLVTDQNGSDVIDFNNIIPQLEEEGNVVSQYLNADLIGVSLVFDQLSELNVQFGWDTRAIGYSRYPRELVNLAWNGNAAILGEPVRMNTPFVLTGYHAFYVGGSYRINDNITVGARGKLLSGFAELSIPEEQSTLNLTTDEDDYSLTVGSDVRLNSSGDIQYDGLDNIVLDYGFDDFSFGQTFSNNLGYAFDLGIQMKYGPFDINASMINLGQLNWKKDVSNLTFRESDNNTFTGLDVLSSYLRGDSVSLEGVLDSIENLFVVDTTREGFTSKLPTEFYLSGKYHINETFNVGALVYLQQFRGEWDYAAAVNAEAIISKWFQVGISYAYRHQAFDALGLNMALSLGPVQFVAATDTMIGLIQPYGTRSVNFRLGLNLVFDRSYGRAPVQEPRTPESPSFF